jgi:hypothetical protein
MAQWTSVTVVHYRVVGEYSGRPVVLIAKDGNRRPGPVTDRVEMEFDWNQTEMKLVGTPVIRNFPSKIGTMPAPAAGCQPDKVEGTAEFATILGLTEGPMSTSGALDLNVRHDYPAGSVCWVNEVGPTWEPAAPRTETTREVFMVAMAMALAMPGVIPTTPDGKSLVMKTADGWTWTQTPTPVK